MERQLISAARTRPGSATAHLRTPVAALFLAFLTIAALAVRALSQGNGPLLNAGGPGSSAAAATGTPVAAVALSALLAPASVSKSDPRLLYDASPDGAWAAYRTSWSGPGPLYLVRSDGSATPILVGPNDRLEPQAARFSPDGARLAVVDGAGALWTIDPQTAQAREIAADGPWGLVFGRSVRFGDNDHVYVQLVGSVEMPIPSRLGVVDLRDASVAVLSDDTWAYAPRPLDGGALAYLHLNEDGSYTARRIDGNKVTDIGNVGFIHGGFDIRADGAVVFSDGDQTQLIQSPGQPARALGAGTNPRFTADGSSVIVYDNGAALSKLMALDGTVEATSASTFVNAVSTGKGS